MRLGIDFLNFHLHFLADREHLAGMFDAVPTHLAHMDHAVDAADIDERAEIANVAHHAFAGLANFQFREQFFLRLGLFALEHAAAAEHEVAAIGVGFHDDAGPALADELFEVFHAVNRNLPGGNEAANFVHFAFQATFVVAGDEGIDGDAFGDIGPIADIDARSGGGQLVQTVFGVEAIDGHIQFAPISGSLASVCNVRMP